MKGVLGWSRERGCFTGDEAEILRDFWEMMRTFRRICGIPIGLPATRWMLELGALFLRTECELILKSRRVIPGRLTESGFEFRFARLEEALREILSTKDK